MEATALDRWWEMNSELDRAVEAILLALDVGALYEAGASLRHLATTLEGHFATEESLYFPLIERVAPSSVERVASARSGHDRARTVLEDLRILLENRDFGSVRRTLVALLQGLRAHEIEESKLISDLRRLAAAS